MKHLRLLLAVAIVALAMALPSIAAAQYHDRQLDNFLNDHTRVKEALSRNPDLIFDKHWRRQHPELQQFMQEHPDIYGKIGNSGRWGAYGPDRDWHDSDWWHEHDPNWMYRNHPEWAERHEDWREDREHHPEWFGGHEGHEEAEEAEHHAHQEAEEAEHHGEMEGTEHKHGHHDNGKHGDHDHDNH